MGTVHREPPSGRGDTPNRKRKAQAAVPDERVTYSMAPTASTRPRYTDRERAMALALLKANGYPDQVGALGHTARELGIPESNLTLWAQGRTQITSELQSEKLDELSDILDRIILEYGNRALDPNVIKATNGKDAVTTLAIAFDKKRLLMGLPTVIVQQMPDVIGALRALGKDPTLFFNDIIARAEERTEYRRLGSGDQAYGKG